MTTNHRGIKTINLNTAEEMFSELVKEIKRQFDGDKNELLPLSFNKEALSENEKIIYRDLTNEIKKYIEIDSNSTESIKKYRLKLLAHLYLCQADDEDSEHAALQKVRLIILHNISIQLGLRLELLGTSTSAQTLVHAEYLFQRAEAMLPSAQNLDHENLPIEKIRCFLLLGCAYIYAVYQDSQKFNKCFESIDRIRKKHKGAAFLSQSFLKYWSALTALQSNKAEVKDISTEKMKFTEEFIQLKNEQEILEKQKKELTKERDEFSGKVSMLVQLNSEYEIKKQELETREHIIAMKEMKLSENRDQYEIEKSALRAMDNFLSQTEKELSSKAFRLDQQQASLRIKELEVEKEGIEFREVKEKILAETYKYYSGWEEELDDEKNQLSRQISELEKKQMIIDKIQATLIEQKKEIQMAQEELNKQKKQFETERDEFFIKNDDLKHKEKQVEKEIEQKNNQFKEITAEISDKTKELNTIKEQVEGVLQSIEKQEQKFETLNNEIKSKQEELESVERKLAAMEADFKGKEEKYEKELQKLKAKQQGMIDKHNQHSMSAGLYSPQPTEKDNKSEIYPTIEEERDAQDNHLPLLPFEVEEFQRKQQSKLLTRVFHNNQDGFRALLKLHQYLDHQKIDFYFTGDFVARWELITQGHDKEAFKLFQGEVNAIVVCDNELKYELAKKYLFEQMKYDLKKINGDEKNYISFIGDRGKNNKKLPIKLDLIKIDQGKVPFIPYKFILPVNQGCAYLKDLHHHSFSASDEIDFEKMDFEVCEDNIFKEACKTLSFHIPSPSDEQRVFYAYEFFKCQLKYAKQFELPNLLAVKKEYDSYLLKKINSDNFDEKKYPYQELYQFLVVERYGCDLFLVPDLNSNQYKNSNLIQLYLYNDNQNQMFFQENDQKFLLEDKENVLLTNVKDTLISHFNQLKHDPIKLEDKYIIDRVLMITSKRGHTERYHGYKEKKLFAIPYLAQIFCIMMINAPHLWNELIQQKMNTLSDEIKNKILVEVNMQLADVAINSLHLFCKNPEQFQVQIDNFLKKSLALLGTEKYKLIFMLENDKINNHLASWKEEIKMFITATSPQVIEELFVNEEDINVAPSMSIQKTPQHDFAEKKSDELEKKLTTTTNTNNLTLQLPEADPYREEKTKLLEKVFKDNKNNLGKLYSLANDYLHDQKIDLWFTNVFVTQWELIAQGHEEVANSFEKNSLNLMIVCNTKEEYELVRKYFLEKMQNEFQKIAENEEIFSCSFLMKTGNKTSISLDLYGEKPSHIIYSLPPHRGLARFKLDDYPLYSNNEIDLNEIDFDVYGDEFKNSCKNLSFLIPPPDDHYSIYAYQLFQCELECEGKIQLPNLEEAKENFFSYIWDKINSNNIEEKKRPYQELYPFFMHTKYESHPNQEKWFLEKEYFQKIFSIITTKWIKKLFFHEIEKIKKSQQLNQKNIILRIINQQLFFTFLKQKNLFHEHLDLFQRQVYQFITGNLNLLKQKKYRNIFSIQNPTREFNGLMNDWKKEVENNQNLLKFTTLSNRKLIFHETPNSSQVYLIKFGIYQAKFDTVDTTENQKKENSQNLPKQK